MRVGEDVDLVWRLAAAGWTIRYEPEAHVAHEHRVRLREWFNRRMDYGTSAAPLARRHPGTLPAVSMSGWSAAAWGLAAIGRPVLGVALTAAVTARLARRLEPLTGSPAPLAAKLAGAGTLRAGRLLGVTLARGWWPVALPAALKYRRLRPAVAAGILIPPLLDWYERRPGLDPVRYTAAGLLDDAAYAIGVWRGCLRERTAAPLLPRLWWRSPADSPGGPAPGPGAGTGIPGTGPQPPTTR
ncbi:MAG: hypothetical protein GEV11_18045 [Streptosporangiales bacterium]|nr:hypothetical protein [Streptosporangiales bacterium]